MNTKEKHNYLERVAYLSYYFFEIAEENAGDGHSVLINLINPAFGKLKMKQLRAEVLQRFIRDERLGMTKVAIETAAWLRSLGIAPLEIEAEPDLLQSICAKYEHHFLDVQSGAERLSRRNQRLVRLLWLMHAHGVGAHSRAIQFFFPDSEILVGRSPKAPVTGYHPEHVVPCAYIRDQSFLRFKERPLVKENQFQEDPVCMCEMTRFVQRLMAVAHIHPDERDQLDKGGNSMKSTMPTDWDPDTGDIFARLRNGAGIESLLPV